MLKFIKMMAVKFGLKTTNKLLESMQWKLLFQEVPWMYQIEQG